jgi:8-oxo-dGTP pyrophosphatase MutT (NUDIX family)
VSGVVVERDAVRAILLTPEREILLMRIHPPEGGDSFWITPGGGLEPGETAEAGLKRELREELGLDDFVLGPLVWRRQHTFDWGDKRISQRERYHVIHVERFEPRLSDAVEMHVFEEFRWWRVADLAQAPERLTPPSLAEIVARYMTEGPPRELPAVEVIVDPLRFGAAPSGVTLHPRHAAYVVVRGDDGRVAAVRVVGRGNARYWLPGGGIERGETPEAAVVRETREELGRTLRLTGKIGEAVQVFYAGDDARWYEMTAVFFGGEFEGEPVGPSEHELCWLDPSTERESFFHACHAWAASRA